MNVIDIIVILLLIFALWRGWSSGILVQLSGIIGVVLGSWVAYKFSEQVGVWLNVDSEYKSLVFVAILIAVMVGVVILGKLLTKLLSYGGLSIPIKILGAIVSFVKVVIVLSLVLRTFEMLNAGGKIADMKYARESVSYIPLNNIATVIFPYIISWGEKVDIDTEPLKEHIESEVKRQVEQELDKRLRDN